MTGEGMKLDPSITPSTKINSNKHKNLNKNIKTITILKDNNGHSFNDLWVVKNFMFTNKIQKTVIK